MQAKRKDLPPDQDVWLEALRQAREHSHEILRPVIRKWIERMKERGIPLRMLRLDKGDTREEYYVRELLATISGLHSALDSELSTKQRREKNGALFRAARSPSGAVLGKWDASLGAELDLSSAFDGRAGFLTRLDNEEIGILSDVFFEEYLAGRVAISPFSVESADGKEVFLRWKTPVLSLPAQKKK